MFGIFLCTTKKKAFAEANEAERIDYRECCSVVRMNRQYWKSQTEPEKPEARRCCEFYSFLHKCFWTICIQSFFSYLLNWSWLNNFCINLLDLSLVSLLISSLSSDVSWGKNKLTISACASRITSWSLMYRFLVISAHKSCRHSINNLPDINFSRINGSDRREEKHTKENNLLMKMSFHVDTKNVLLVARHAFNR